MDGPEASKYQHAEAQGIVDLGPRHMFSSSIQSGTRLDAANAQETLASSGTT